jgi:Trk K+ transport system NAD-binding subunit
MTEGYSLILPLLTATFVAQWVADSVGDKPIYDALLERDLERTSKEPASPGTVLLELDVLPEAPFAGRRVADLGLPRGLLFVAIERRGSSHVPTGETKLEVWDRLSVAVAPEAAKALGILREGLGIDDAET